MVRRRAPERQALYHLLIGRAPSRTMRAARGRLALRSARSARLEGAAPQDEAAWSFETHRTVGKCRLCDAPQDEADTRHPYLLVDFLQHREPGLLLLLHESAGLLGRHRARIVAHRREPFFEIRVV